MQRLSARESRLRKKQRQAEVLRQIAHYEAENLSLRLKLKIGHEAVKMEENETLQFTAKLESMVKEGASDVDIRTAIQEMQEKYADYGSTYRFHLVIFLFNNLQVGIDRAVLIFI